MRQAHCLVTALALLAILCPAARLFAQTAAKNDAVKLELEVDALAALNDLQLSSEQAAALRDLASDTAAKVDQSSGPVDADYQAALAEVRLAILSRNDDRIDQAQDKLTDLAQKRDADSEPDIDDSDVAKAKAPGFLKSLAASQIAHYLAQNADNVENPGDVLVDALHQCRNLSDADFEVLRDDTAEEIGLLAGGLVPTKPPQIIQKTTRFLNRCRRLSAQEFQTQQSALEDEARKLVEGLDPIQCLRHWMEGELADLLSNPQLQTALKDWGSSAKTTLNKPAQ
jgi:hypothetical protein